VEDSGACLQATTDNKSKAGKIFFIFKSMPNAF
jgi:hypothetical protein